MYNKFFFDKEFQTVVCGSPTNISLATVRCSTVPKQAKGYQHQYDLNQKLSDKQSGKQCLNSGFKCLIQELNTSVFMSQEYYKTTRQTCTIQHYAEVSVNSLFSYRFLHLVFVECETNDILWEK